MIKRSIPKLNKTIHPFRKKWGQNFLRDPNTISKIVTLLNLEQMDTILEVGPGDGALTDMISEKAGYIHVVEIDPLLISTLKRKKYKNVVIHEGDILDWDMSILPERIKVIGNLPYYISSPILFYFFELGGSTFCTTLRKQSLEIPARPPRQKAWAKRGCS